MKRKDEHNDWTGALKESLQDYGVAPSAGAWERLEAASAGGRQQAAWWPWALGLAAAVAALGLFLFIPEGRKDGGVQIAEVRQAEAPAAEETVGQQEQPDAGIMNAQPATENRRADAGKAVSVRKSVYPITSAADAVAAMEKQAEAADGQEAAPNGDDSAVSISTAQEPRRDEPSETEAPAVVETETPATEQAVQSGRDDAATQDGQTGAPAVSPQPLDPGIFAEPAPRTKAPRQRVSFGISRGGGLQGSAGMNPTVHSGGPKKASARRYSIGEFLNHDAPSSVEATMFIPLSGRLHLETGLDFTRMDSRFGDITQEVRLTGIPLRLGYKLLEWNRFDFSVSAGGMREVCTLARLMDKSYDEPVQYSANAGALARFRLAGPFSLYASPQLSYYFTPTTLSTYRSRNPLMFTACAGLSIQF